MCIDAIVLHRTIGIGRGMHGLASEGGGGAEGNGAELMNNIAIASIHAILFIDILGPTFVMSGGHGPPGPHALFRRL